MALAAQMLSPNNDNPLHPNQLQICQNYNILYMRIQHPYCHIFKSTLIFQAPCDIYLYKSYRNIASHNRSADICYDNV